MTGADFLAAIRRQWLLVLIGLLASAGLTGAAYLMSKSTYEATATILLLPPSASVVESGNPYLQLGGLGQAVDLLGVAMSDQNTTRELRAVSSDVSFSLKADPNSTSPLLVIDVNDSSPEGALTIRDLLVSRVPARLDDMQKSLSVAPTHRITSTLVTSDTEAKVVGHNRLRAAVVVFSAGVALTLGLAAWRDSRPSGRTAKSSGAADSPAGGDDLPPTAPSGGGGTGQTEADGRPDSRPPLPAIRGDEEPGLEFVPTADASPWDERGALGVVNDAAHHPVG